MQVWEEGEEEDLFSKKEMTLQVCHRHACILRVQEWRLQRRFDDLDTLLAIVYFFFVTMYKEHDYGCESHPLTTELVPFFGVP
jgi:hypothetical protein